MIKYHTWCLVGPFIEFIKSRLKFSLFSSVACRMKRFPSERHHDDVAIELIKERDMIEGVQGILQRVVEQISEQIRWVWETMCRPNQGAHRSIWTIWNMYIKVLYCVALKTCFNLCSRLNRSSKYQLEKDLKEKFEAECIDNSCAVMTTHSAEPLNSKHTETVMPR